MDLQLAKERPGRQPRIRILPRGEEGLRAAIDQAMGQAIGHVKDQAKDQAPRAEAAAARWIERTRPAWSWLALEWRRLGTMAAIVLIVGLMLHAMFGANGMVIYRQKRGELQALRTEVERLQKENGEHVDHIDGFGPSRRSLPAYGVFSALRSCRLSKDIPGRRPFGQRA